jgi:hypothetical protein
VQPASIIRVNKPDAANVVQAELAENDAHPGPEVSSLGNVNFGLESALSLACIRGRCGSDEHTLAGQSARLLAIDIRFRSFSQPVLKDPSCKPIAVLSS